MGRPQIDIKGQRFGRLLVVKLSEQRTASGQVVWECQCDCGTTKFITGGGLRQGYHKSCGCYLIERGREQGLSMRKHGMYNTPEYTAWTSMKQRCTNTGHKSYANYGGRGIKVCKRWLQSFENFYADMGPKPEKLSLDRINNDGNYTPKNCRWTTSIENMNNRRRTTMLTANGYTMSLRAWSEKTGITRNCIDKRIRRGWSHAQALELV